MADASAKGVERVRAQRIRTGLYRLVGVAHAVCGGEIHAEGGMSADPEFQWGCFCVKCKACDRNGYSTLKACKEAAREFWMADAAKRRKGGVTMSGVQVLELMRLGKRLVWFGDSGPEMEGHPFQPSRRVVRRLLRLGCIAWGEPLNKTQASCGIVPLVLRKGK